MSEGSHSTLVSVLRVGVSAIRDKKKVRRPYSSERSSWIANDKKWRVAYGTHVRLKITMFEMWQMYNCF